MSSVTSTNTLFNRQNYRKQDFERCLRDGHFVSKNLLLLLLCFFLLVKNAYLIISHIIFTTSTKIKNSLLIKLKFLSIPLQANRSRSHYSLKDRKKKIRSHLLFENFAKILWPLVPIPAPHKFSYKVHLQLYFYHQN